MVVIFVRACFILFLYNNTAKNSWYVQFDFLGIILLVDPAKGNSGFKIIRVSLGITWNRCTPNSPVWMVAIDAFYLCSAVHNRIKVHTVVFYDGRPIDQYQSHTSQK